MIRRFVAKGRDIDHLTRQTFRDIEVWSNNYPRRILNLITPEELFLQEIKAIT